MPWRIIQLTAKGGSNMFVQGIDAVGPTSTLQAAFLELLPASAGGTIRCGQLRVSHARVSELRRSWRAAEPVVDYTAW